MHGRRGSRRGGLGELTLVSLPVRLFLRANQHADDLVRELLLVMHDSRSPGRDMRRMAAVVDDFARVVAPSRNGVTARVQAAYDAGVTTLDVRASWPRAAVPLIESWHAVLDELDDLSRRGAVLAVPATPDVQALHRWHRDELIGQLRDGRPPVAWAAPADARGDDRHSFA